TARLVQPPAFNPIDLLPAGPPSTPAGPSPGVGTPNPGGNSNGGPPGASFFQVASPARSVVYVLDRSGSMGPSGALERAKAELLLSLRRLPPEMLFQVIAYNDQP